MSFELLAETAESEQSILLPAPYDLFWGTVCFVIILGLFWKFVLPTLRKVMAERTEKIEGGIARAGKLQQEAEQARADYQRQLQEANMQAASIRSAAHHEGDQIIASAREEAAATAAAVAARADAQIAAEREAAIGSLRREVGELAMTLAGKIVGESLATDRRAKASVDRFIAELEKAAAAKAKS